MAKAEENFKKCLKLFDDNAEERGNRSITSNLSSNSPTLIHRLAITMRFK